MLVRWALGDDDVMMMWWWWRRWSIGGHVGDDSEVVIFPQVFFPFNLTASMVYHFSIVSGVEPVLTWLQLIYLFQLNKESLVGWRRHYNREPSLFCILILVSLMYYKLKVTFSFTLSHHIKSWSYNVLRMLNWIDSDIQYRKCLQYCWKCQVEHRQVCKSIYRSDTTSLK